LKKKRVIVSVTTDLHSDQRVHKTCLSLYSRGFDVLLVGRKLKNSFIDSGINQELPYSIYRFNLFFKKGFMFYMTFNIRLLFFLFFNKSDILFANDLDTLIPNFIVSKFKKNHLVYDSHELFTEVPELNNRVFVKSFWLYIERFIFPRLKNIITVSDAIASFYFKKYNINIQVVRNVPFKTKCIFESKQTLTNSFEKELCVAGSKIIYQGSLNKDRGIELMIRAMKYIDSTLFIVGDGDIKNSLESLVKKIGISDRVKFLGRVPFFNLKSITKKMDLGLSLEEDVCLAYRYSLPNKIFDYVHAEIPVLVSNLPEMMNVVNKYKIGKVLQSREPQDVACEINDILLSKKSFEGYFLKAKNELCWEREQEKLFKIFHSF
tara:strand:+ start:221 stop:1351 length:1131 start_codon:yes stop_codon:yes gene_type:complete